LLKSVYLGEERSLGGRALKQDEKEFHAHRVKSAKQIFRQDVQIQCIFCIVRPRRGESAALRP
jgi:hypothetical protein